jgi:hypothetical protein
MLGDINFLPPRCPQCSVRCGPYTFIRTLTSIRRFGHSNVAPVKRTLSGSGS